jgi:metal-responsive CopG/Arc/MetJ family transcriptional regulator
MKQKISVSIEEELIKLLEQELGKGLFRSRSHIIEFILANYIKNQLTENGN